MLHENVGPFDAMDKCDIKKLRSYFKHPYKIYVYRGHTPLEWALRKNCEKCIRCVLDNYKIDYGNPFHIIIDTGNVEWIDLLLDYNYDPNKEDVNKNTPLHLCILRGKINVAKALLRSTYCLEIDKLNYFHQTPLQLALNGGYFDIAKTLLRRGGTFTKTEGRDEIDVFLKNECRFMNYRHKTNKKREELFEQIALYDFVTDGGDDTVHKKFDYLSRTIFFKNVIG